MTIEKDKNIDISLEEIILIFKDFKTTFFVFCLSSLVISSGISLIINDKYKSEATLVSQYSDSSSLVNLASNYGGLASLAGVDLPGSNIDRSLEGIELIKSFSFFERLSYKQDLFFSLMAVEGWNEENNILLINEDIYDVEQEKWISKLPFSVNGKPSLQTAHKEFIERLSVAKEIDTGFVRISFIHYSPNESKRFVQAIIEEINEVSRQDEITRGENSLLFLRNELENSQFVEIKNALNELIAGQLERIMLANSSPNFLFKTLSPPYAPEEKDSPNRSLFVLMGLLLGILLFVLYVFLARLKGK